MKKYTAEEKEKALEPLRIALQIETEGKKFLLEAAERCERPIAKRTFTYLAEQEDLHYEKIQRMYQAIAETGESIDPEADETEAAQKIRDFNDKLAELRDSVEASADDIEAYKTALEMEEDTEQFYQEKIGETDDENIKQIYRYLIAEEKAHSVMLQSCLNFMEDPSAWFITRKESDWLS